MQEREKKRRRKRKEKKDDGEDRPYEQHQKQNKTRKKTEPAVTEDRSGTEHESKSSFTYHIDTTSVATLPTKPTTGFDNTQGP